MNLDWGKKVCCPKCSARFYSMKKVSLICPNCKYKFEISELTNRKSAKVARDEIAEYNEELVITEFTPVDEETTTAIDENEALAEEQEIVRDIKVTDE